MRAARGPATARLRRLAVLRGDRDRDRAHRLQRRAVLALLIATVLGWLFAAGRPAGAARGLAVAACRCSCSRRRLAVSTVDVRGSVARGPAVRAAAARLARPRGRERRQPARRSPREGARAVAAAATRCSGVGPGSTKADPARRPGPVRQGGARRLPGRPARARRCSAAPALSLLIVARRPCAARRSAAGWRWRPDVRGGGPPARAARRGGRSAMAGLRDVLRGAALPARLGPVRPDRRAGAVRSPDAARRSPTGCRCARPSGRRPWQP